ncbi:GntR family transcriptional regulator [Agrococcus lahaulensis]|uniref:GntR family transcriptional regulator n=1 Tax=Agrococcus lahaulensis TaxID=341722 RepID=UPI001B7FDC4F|nr:GntR family transcriptional regulator [Agrococcus lahaulensis]
MGEPARRGRAAASMPSIRIDRLSADPMYDQLRRQILATIADEGLSPGDLLPGELRMCEQYGVSRTVVRQALGQLEHDGIITRVKGKGTFVAPQKTAETLASGLAGLHEEVAARGGTVRSEVLRLEREPAGDRVAAALGCDVGTPIVVLERLRFVDDERWSLSTTWMPERIGALAFDAELEEGSLYAHLRAHGVRAARGVRSVEATVTDAREGQLLGIGPGKPVLLLRSTVLDDADQPIEHFEALHRGDRTRFEFRLSADDAHGPAFRTR